MGQTKRVNKSHVCPQRETFLTRFFENQIIPNYQIENQISLHRKLGVNDESDSDCLGWSRLLETKSTVTEGEQELGKLIIKISG